MSLVLPSVHSNNAEWRGRKYPVEIPGADRSCPILYAEGGFFSTTHLYLVSYKGFAFFTKSSKPMLLPPGVETIVAAKIWSHRHYNAAALPVITDGLTINGPGAGVLTVSGGSAFQVFNITGGVTVSTSGPTIANGMSFVGAVLNAGTLTATNSLRLRALNRISARR